MNTDMVDANGCIAVLWSQVAHMSKIEKIREIARGQGL
jgi:hypothetical protein